jgi:hypothetical protein
MDIIFLNVIVLIFDQYVFTHLQPFPNFESKLISNDINIIFYDRCNLDVLKGKPIKF